MSIEERKEREREELRSRIIRTASELVSAEGHENLTIRKLARAIEYSPRTIYLYFRDKEHLLHEIVEEGFRRTLEMRREEEERKRGSGVPSRDGQKGKTGREILARRLRDHIRSALGDPNFYRAVVTILLEKSYEPGPAQREIIEKTRKELGELLEEEGRREDEIESLAMIIFSTIRGFSLSLLNAGERVGAKEREELIEHYIAFVQKGIGGREE